MNIDELMIKLGLDPSDLKQGISKAQGMLNDFSTGFMQGFQSKIAAGFAGVLGGAALTALYNQYTATADAMGKMADALDLNIEDLHAWSEAAGRAGGSAEAFQASVRALSGQLARQATMGTSRAGAILEAQGIATVKDDGSAREVFDVFEDLAAKAKEMSKAEFFGIGRALGLDQGTIMLLQQGRDGLKDAVRLQKQLGTYTKEDAQVTAYFNDRVADSKQAFMALASIVFRMVTPALSYMVEGLTNFVSYLRKHENAVKAFFLLIAGLISTLVIPAFAQMAAALLANPIFQIAAVLAGLALVIEDLVVWANGGKSALGDMWAALFGSPDEALKLWSDIKTGAVEAWTTLKTAAADAINYVSGLLDKIDWAAIGRDARAAWDTISTGAAELYAFLEPLISSMLTAVGDMIDALVSLWTNHSDTIMTVLGALWDAIKTNLASALKILGTAVGIVGAIISTSIELIAGFIELALKGIDKLITGAEWVVDKWKKAKAALGFGDDEPPGEPEKSASLAAETAEPDDGGMGGSFGPTDYTETLNIDVEGLADAQYSTETFFSGVQDSASSAADWIKSGFSSAYESVTQTAGEWADAAKNAASDAGNYVAETAGEIAGTIATKAGETMTAAAELAAAIVSQAQALGDSISDVIGKIMDVFGRLKELILAGLDVIGGAFGNLASRIISALGSAFSWVAEKWTSLSNMIGNASIAVDVTGAAAVDATGSGAYYQSSESTTDVNINNLTVQTQATDADGIASNISGALDSSISSSYLANQGNVGVVT